VTVSDLAIGPNARGARSFYVDALSGFYSGASGALPIVYVQGLIDSQGILSYEVADLGRDVPVDDWQLAADGTRLHGVGLSGSATPIDVNDRWQGAQRDIGETAVDLVREWWC